MKKYTIGALFTKDLENIVLILKQKPAWQRGYFNLPGGSVEDGESEFQCVNREFIEECNVSIGEHNWIHIGHIVNHGNYYVDFLTAIYDPENHSEVKTITNEEVEWHPVKGLPANALSNLSWLIPFALNIHKQGNADSLVFGTFTYRYK